MITNYVLLMRKIDKEERKKFVTIYGSIYVKKLTNKRRTRNMVKNYASIFDLSQLRNITTITENFLNKLH